MIFSRMSEALREQNWFVVAIEILVLVVGIFIGLQVDEWNQQRQDKDDEQHFLKRLHADIETAEHLSSRVRDRRLARNQVLTDAADVIFGRIDQDQLTPDQCIAVYASSFFNINVTSLPSAEELMGTGRLSIIRNSELRTALVELKQTRETLQFLILIQVTATGNRFLASEYPELIELTSWFDPAANEAKSEPKCNLELMKNNRAFLNDLSIGIDSYDAYVRDGLQPWLTHFDKVHQILDAELSIHHL